MFRLADGSEKGAVSEQCNAERVGDSEALAAEKREAGPATALRSAGDVECDFVCGEKRLHLADDAEGVSALATGLLLFCEVAGAGRVATAQCHATRSRAAESG